MDIRVEKATIEKVKALYDEGKNVRDVEWSWKEIDVLNENLYLTAKPMVYLVNVSEVDYIKKKNKWLAKIVAWVNAHGGGKIIPYSVAFEVAYDEAKDKEEFVKLKGADSALGKIIKEGYHSLDLLHYFTCGSDEVKCWTFRRGIKAPQAAGIIHSDFERGFISAEIMKFEDLNELGSETNVKKEGKVKNEGKQYEVCDGDCILFKFNVSDPTKKKK